MQINKFTNIQAIAKSYCDCDQTLSLPLFQNIEGYYLVKARFPANFNYSISII